MRIHRLSATAFGPFPDEVQVDFDALTAQGLFLIHGPTGAGKTSLLDAICFALFADVPGVRDRRGIVSDHAAPGVVPSVELEFTSGTRRLRLHRQPAHSRPKKRGTGFIDNPATVQLSEHRGGEWVVISTRNDEAAEVLDDVIGMGKEQFAKVAMLPQGEFAAFLTAKDEDRRVLLEKLFDITRFADVEDWLVTQRRASESEVGALRSGIDTDLARLGDVIAASGVEAGTEGDQSGDPTVTAGQPVLDPHSPEAIRARVKAIGAELDAHLSDAMVTLEAAVAADAEAVGEAESGRAVIAQRARAAAAHATLAALESVADQIDGVRERVEVARRASSLSGHFAATDRAAAELTEAAALREQLTQQLTVLLGDGAAGELPGPAALLESLRTHDDAVDELQRVGAAQSTRHREARQLAQTLAESQAILDRADTDREQAAAQVEAAETSVADAREADVALPGAEAEAKRTHDLVVLAQRVTAAARALDGLAETAARARTDAQDARDHEQDLLGRRLAQMAAELAEGLADGDACPVCGAHEHPHPAESGDRVSATELEAARERHATLVAVHQQAQEQASSARARVDEALAALSVDTVAQLDLEALTTAADEAATQLRLLRSRAGGRSAAEQALTAAREALTGVEQQVKQAHAKVAKVATLVDQATAAQHADAVRVVELLAAHDDCPCGPPTSHEDAPRVTASDAARGTDTDLIGELADRHAAAVEAAVDWRRACDTHEATLSRYRAIADDGDSAATEAGFASLHGAREFALPTGELERLADRVRDHERRGASARGVLADEAVISALAADEPDLEHLTDRAAVARSALLAAQSAQAQATNARSSFTTVRSSLLRGLDAAGPALERHHRVKELADTFAGSGHNNTLRMRLTSYVLAARLDKVATLANERLRVMGGGRYALEHTDRLAARGARSGLGLQVLDQWTGVSRETSTLSGGEAFMASLALALGLADAVREESGGFDLGTLFVDEGFGTLDDESLEEVISVLDGLREGGRAVGVVSHVGELRSRITSQLVVRKTASGSSVAISTPGAESAA